jgi:D-amino-acid oxidase
MDNETFDMMWKLSEPGGAFERCFLRIPQTESYMEQWAGRHELEHLPDVCMSLVPRVIILSTASQFRWLEKGELPEGAVCGVKFTTLTIDTPVFLSWLSSRFLAAGGTLIRGSVQHISQLAEAGARLFIPSSKVLGVIHDILHPLTEHVVDV